MSAGDVMARRAAYAQGMLAERRRWWSPEYPGQQPPALAAWWRDEPEDGLSGFDTEADRAAFQAGEEGPFIRRVTGNEHRQMPYAALRVQSSPASPDLTEARAMLDGVTDGPWDVSRCGEWVQDGRKFEILNTSDCPHDVQEIVANASFIAYARNNWAGLLDAIAAERAKTARLVEAATALRSDMLNRAEIGVSNGVRIQNVKGVGRTAWHDFCAAIAACEVGK